MLNYMTKFQNTFDPAIWKTVSGIVSGRVKSYGEVARLAGFPRHARMVSMAMSRSKQSLPWYRVVRSDRTLAFEIGSESYNKQQSLLEKEGVQFINGKVVPVEFEQHKNLDELIWGPGS